MKHKRDIKKIQHESEVSCNQALYSLWNQWDDEKKNAWYEQYSDVPEKDSDDIKAS